MGCGSPHAPRVASAGCSPSFHSGQAPIAPAPARLGWLPPYGLGGSAASSRSQRRAMPSLLLYGLSPSTLSFSIAPRCCIHGSGYHPLVYMSVEHGAACLTCGHARPSLDRGWSLAVLALFRLAVPVWLSAPLAPLLATLLLCACPRLA